MANSDAELITEVRSFTGYSADVFTDSEIQETMDTAKEEIRSYIVPGGSDPSDFDFFGNNSLNPRREYDAVRALFWFTCIGLKMRAGEIAAADLTIDGLEQASINEEEYAAWFNNFWRKIESAQPADVKGAQSIQLTRDNRTYGDQ